MAIWLKQSTAVTLKIGPFLDETDGKTAETGLTISQADVRLSKNGGDIAQKNESTSCTHDELGIYGCPIDTTDTGTLGRLQLWVHESGALPVWHEFMVVPANVWDSLYGADYLQTHAVEITAGLITDTAIADGAIDAATFAADVDAEILSYLVDDATRIDASSLNTAAVTSIPAILADTGTDGVVVAAASKTGYTLTATTGLGNQTANITGNLSGSVGSVTGAVGSVTGNVGGNVTGSVGSVVGHTPQTGDSYALANGASGFVAIKNQVAAIETDTQDLQTQVGTDGAGLTNLPWNAAWDAEVQSEVFDALNAELTDATSLTANGLLDRLRSVMWILRNKIEVTDANGNTVIYKDDSTTAGFTVNAMLTDNSTTTTRLRAA